MTGLQLTAVFTLALGSWGIMCLAMQKRTPLRMLIVLLCLVAFVGAFALGSYWNHDDFTCKPGAHCFPWGD